MAFAVSKRFHSMKQHRGPDKVGADETQARYPALDLEDLCKLTKNPKCEAVVENFCLKSCNDVLCADHGSIRGMCRLMCEAEDLPPPCLKMGSSKLATIMPMNPYNQPFQNMLNLPNMQYGQIQPMIPSPMMPTPTVPTP
jgi:hypothetical protein